jgi:hypothetical protein
MYEQGANAHGRRAVDELNNWDEIRMGNRARDGQGIPKGRDRVGHGWAIDGKGSKNSKEKGSSKEEGGGPSASWAGMEVYA